MKAPTLTLTITVNPYYADAEAAKQEIIDSLDWISGDHYGIKLEWGETGEGEWPDGETTEDPS